MLETKLSPLQEQNRLTEAEASSTWKRFSTHFDSLVSEVSESYIEFHFFHFCITGQDNKWPWKMNLPRKDKKYTKNQTHLYTNPVIAILDMEGICSPEEQVELPHNCFFLEKMGKKSRSGSQRHCFPCMKIWVKIPEHIRKNWMWDQRDGLADEGVGCRA